MSHSIVFLTASPAPASRSAFVARAIAAETQRAGLRPVFWSLSDFDPADVLVGRGGAPGVARFVEAVKQAVGVVLATPVYKGVYAGSLKAIVDLIPPDALVDKPALGIATAKQAAHSAGVGHAFEALFLFFKARAQGTLFLCDDELRVGPEGGSVSAYAEQMVRRAARSLVDAVEGAARAASPP
jgi:FMN reductase